MTLKYEKTPGEWVVWNGEEVNGIKHPLTIERFWSDMELADKGFQRVVAEPKIAEVTSEQVKEQAYGRIIAVVPEWKQRNLLAQATNLLRKGESNWTQEEQAAWIAGEAIWAKVAAIRAASDALELTLPVDYEDDKWWPSF